MRRYVELAGIDLLNERSQRGEATPRCLLSSMASGGYALAEVHSCRKASYRNQLLCEGIGAMPASGVSAAITLLLLFVASAPLAYSLKLRS
jgi:hypothetical protein